MNYIAIGLASLSAIAGLVGAYLWYQASRVEIIPLWAELGHMEPVDPIQAQSHWLHGQMSANAKSSKLNCRAAIWTACAVVLGAASTLAGAAGL